MIKDILLMFGVGTVVGMITFYALTFIKGKDALYYIPAPPTWAGVAGIIGIVAGAMILKKLMGV